MPADYDLDAEVASGALDRRIRAIIGDRPYEIVWKSVYRFHSRIAYRMRVGRVLLAGDAAHLVSPFGARGLNSGVADAENAAWKIAHVGYGWAPEELLESYHAERHAAARENLAVTTATMDFLVPPDAERAAHRADVLARAAVDPAARAHVDSGRLAEPFWYARLAADHARPDPPVRRPPAPRRSPPGRPRRAGPRRPPARRVFIFDTASRRFRHGRSARAAARARPGRLPRAARRRRRPRRRRRGRPGRRRAGRGWRALDPAVAAALGARPGEAWVLRPDAHVAAVVQTADLETALCRALGRIPRHPTEGARPCRTTTAAVTSPRSATPSTADPTGASTPRS